MKNPIATISNCRKNIMGTISFDGKFAGMRKAQDFIVYPCQDSGPRITIQSDTRIGMLDLDTGKLLLSESRPNGTYFIHLQTGKRTVATLPMEEVQTLRGFIRSTGGVEVGKSIVKCDNTGALAL